MNIVPTFPVVDHMQEHGPLLVLIATCPAHL